jgi:hypothetical protein
MANFNINLESTEYELTVGDDTQGFESIDDLADHLYEYHCAQYKHQMEETSGCALESMASEELIYGLLECDDGDGISVCDRTRDLVDEVME